MNVQDRSADGQTQTHPLALGAEEWLEELFAERLRNAHSAVTDLDFDELLLPGGLNRKYSLTGRIVTHGVE
jgi:hypothetical protein